MSQCGHHERAFSHRVCQHIDLEDFSGHYMRFSGRGIEYAIVCPECQTTPWNELNRVCEDCFRKAERSAFNRLGMVGGPEVLVAEQEYCALEMLGSMTFSHAILAGAKWHNRWLILLEDLSLHWVDPFGHGSEQVGSIIDPCQIDWSQPVDLITSSDGRYAAITNRKGQHGLVWDLNWDRFVMRLDRGDYHSEQTPFPVCFMGVWGNSSLIAATDWNRLDIFDLPSGALLTPRETKWTSGLPTPAHYLDYFVGEVVMSPNEQTLLVDGWVWQPFGVVGMVNLAAWRAGSVHSCKDSLKEEGIRCCDYGWNVGKAFLNEREVILWGIGIGNDSDYMIDGAVVYDLRSKVPVRSFAGPPNARFYVDDFLFCFSPEHDTSAWNIATGERVWLAKGHHASVYNPNSKHFLAWDGNVMRVSRWIQAVAEDV